MITRIMASLLFISLELFPLFFHFCRNNNRPPSVSKRIFLCGIGRYQSTMSLSNIFGFDLKIGIECEIKSKGIFFLFFFASKSILRVLNFYKHSRPDAEDEHNPFCILFFNCWKGFEILSVICKQERDLDPEQFLSHDRAFSKEFPNKFWRSVSPVLIYLHPKTFSW